jgi:predicted ABC-class ATPase
VSTFEDLRRILHRIDGRGYRAYKDIEGRFAAGALTLFIDHVQGDPFAAPSKVRIRLEQSAAGLPAELHRNAVRRLALEDFIARRVADAIGRAGGGARGSGKSGLIEIDSGRQEVLERTAVVVTPGWVEARLYVGLPAAGRRVLGRQAEAILCQELARIAEESLHWSALPQAEARAFVECVENQERVRDKLEAEGLVAFVADGAILPRASGASDRPLDRRTAVPFSSPGSLRVRVPLENPVPGREGPTDQLTGLGIPRGVTLIVGGGYHGKSTLLQALERGVYPHVVGDGREYVVTARDTVKIRAEDGRRVEAVDISPFITNLPLERSTTAFSTDDASGSTSQAANIVEVLEVGARVILLDEDTSATNFMVRDARMQALVHKEHEPITPFVDRVRELYDTLGVSTVMVMGGCGDYFEVADTIIMMRDYLPEEVTREAREIARSQATGRRGEAKEPIPARPGRIPQRGSFDASRGRRAVKIDAKALDLILFGTDRIDLRGVEQLVDMSQTRAIGQAIHLATERFMDGKARLDDVVNSIEEFFDRQGLDGLDPFHRPGCHPGSLARPRKYEIAAAVNRLRTVRMRQS